MNDWMVTTIAGIGITSILCQWLAWRARLPAILFLLIAGLILGPVLGWVNPDRLFGDLLFPLISLCVAIILFEGSLTLELKEIRNLKSVVRRLVTSGALITWLIVAVATHSIIGLSVELSILFGAVTIVTGPTVIMPLLRTVRLNRNLTSVLRWEGIVIDPIGALLTVVVFEFIVSTTHSSGLLHSLQLFGEIILTGFAIGIGAGYGLGLILRRQLIPDYLHSTTALCLLFAVFALSNQLAHESGLLSVTLMGIWLANMRDVHIHNILNFKENLTVLLISGLFILLAARLDIQHILALGPPLLVLLAVVLFVARPLSVLVATLGSNLDWRERSMLAWIAPRGIVAAAVSALFAMQLQAAGIAGADLLVPLTFFIIVGTVTLQSATAGLLARVLRVIEPKPRGFLIIGANPVAREIASVLGQLDVRVLLCDSNWDNISAARMAGLETFYGNPVSDYAEQRLDLSGIGKLLCLSPQREMNTIAAMHYRGEFGPQYVYTLLSSAETANTDKHQIAASHRGYTLFDHTMTYAKFASLLSQGLVIRKTRLSEEYDYSDFLADNESRAYPLFAQTGKNKLEFFVADGKLSPEPGWTVFCLMPEKERSEKPDTK